MYNTNGSVCLCVCVCGCVHEVGTAMRLRMHVCTPAVFKVMSILGNFGLCVSVHVCVRAHVLSLFVAS